MADSRSLSARATMYKLVVDRSRTFLKTAMQTNVFPVSDKMFKDNIDKTSKAVIKRLRELSSSVILARLLRLNVYHN